MSSPLYQQVLQSIQQSNESVAVNYGLCRERHALTVAQDIEIGVFFIESSQFDLAKDWFKLVSQRAPNHCDLNIVFPLLDYLNTKNHTEALDFKLLEQPLAFEHRAFFPILTPIYLKEKRVKEWYLSFEALKSDLEITQKAIRNVKKWIAKTESLELLDELIEHSLIVNTEHHLTFMFSAIVKYYSLQPSLSLAQIETKFGNRRTYHHTFSKRLSHVFIDKEQYDDALQLLSEQAPKSHQCFIHARIFVAQGYWSKALDALEQCLSDKTFSPSTLFYVLLSKAAILSRGPQHALDVLQKIYSDNPNSIQLVGSMAQIYTDYFSHEKALQLLEPFNSNPSVLAKYLTIMARLPFHESRHVQLLSMWEKAINDFPESKQLIITYFDYLMQNFLGKRVLGWIDKILSLELLPSNIVQRKAIELSIMEHHRVDEIVVILKQYLNIRNDDWMDKCWVATQLLKCGEHHFVYQQITDMPMPKFKNAELFGKYRELSLDLGLKSIYKESIEVYLKDRPRSEYLKLCCILANEGSLDTAESLLNECQSYSFEKYELKLTKLLMAIVKNEFLVIQDELYQLIKNTSSPEPLLRSFYFMLELSDHENLLELCNDFLNKYPTHILANSVKGQCLVALNRVDEAKKWIEKFGTPECSKMVILKQWQLAIKGEVLQARTMFNQYSRFSYHNWRDASVQNLERIDDNPLPKKDDIVVYCVFKNEAKRIPAFVEHYKQLGADHFIIIDNGSEDPTLELLKHYEHMNVFSIPDNYVAACYGMRWINYLADKYASSNWRIVADADEFLVYPHCERLKLPQLRDYLEKHDFEVVQGFMLDMIPEKLNHFKHYESSQNPIEVSKYFDVSHRRIFLEQCPYSTFAGGSRHRIVFGNTFHTRQPLCKTVMIKGGRGIYHTSANHYCSPAKVADITTVFLHHKFLVDWQNRGYQLAQDIAHGTYAGILKQYSDFSNNNGDVSLLSEDSVAYLNSQQLIELGLIVEGGFNPTHDTVAKTD